MRSGAPMLCLAIAALIAGPPVAWGAGSDQKLDAQVDAKPAKKGKGAKPEHGAEATAPPPPKTGCYYDPNAPAPPPVAEQAQPDGHAAETNAKQPAAGHESAAHTVAPAEPAHTAPPAAAAVALDNHNAKAVTQPVAPPAEPPPTASEADQPYMLIRTLEAVQDKIASGSRDAHVYQRELIAEIAKQLVHVKDEDWKQPRNSRAAIIYALSGGEPAVLTKLLSLSPIPCVDDNLLKGLLDYSQGNAEAAMALLSKIDAQTLDPRAGGHLALAQAMLVAKDDPKRAIVYLDLARLLAPGTLVEEAALRREAIIAALAEDLDKFRLLTSQYLRRYNKSVYADDFLRRFANAVRTGKYSESPSLLQALVETLDELGMDQRKLAYSAIAEAAIVKGNVLLTLMAARKLAEQAKDDPKRAVQARLYESAVLLLSDDYERAFAQLKSIDRAELGRRDQPLLDAALAVARRMRAEVPAMAPGSPPPPVSAEQGKDAELPQLPPVVGKANKAIGKVDELLDGDKR